MTGRECGAVNDSPIRRSILMAYLFAAGAVATQVPSSSFFPGGLFYIGTIICAGIALGQIFRPVIEYYIELLEARS